MYSLQWLVSVLVSIACSQNTCTTNVKIFIMLEYITVGSVGASKIDESRAPIFFQETNLAKTPTPPNDMFSFFFANIVNYGRPLNGYQKTTHPLTKMIQDEVFQKEHHKTTNAHAT